MNKHVKRMIAIACTSVVGLGVAASPVMAATTPTGTTDVFYTTDSTNIDADGKVVMVVPASISLNKNNTFQEFEVTMKTTDPTQVLPENFQATVKVDSENKGKLKTVDSKEAEYSLSVKQQVVDLTQADQPFHNFSVSGPGTQSVEQSATVSVDNESSKKMENEKPGTVFKDKLTFKVISISGDGLVDPNKQP